MSEIWMQGRYGRPINLTRPTADEVDFREIADSLAQINRYCGAATKPVSVGMHTLIAFDAAAHELRPWVLLHDAHETRIGDMTTPMKAALCAVAREHYAQGGLFMRQMLAALAERHDVAIHEAAGLPLPTDAQKQAIKRADIIALQTERRDFLGPSARAWAPEIEAVSPLSRVYRLRAAHDVADQLFGLFRQYLPALPRERL